MNCAEIEGVYLRSRFIRECCVVSVPCSPPPAGERWHAVVVPNMAAMRQRRIANIGDLLRFEIEGQSIDLPIDQRAASYEIWFEPLPRAVDGAIDRHEIARRVLEKRRRDDRHQAGEAATGLAAADEFEAEALAMIAARVSGRRLTPHGNLEIDLGLDSIDRVELVAGLEARFGVSIRPDAAHEILTVAQLIAAVRPPAPWLGRDRPDPPGGFWTTMLRDLPSSDDPVLGSVLERRLVVPATFFVLLRIARWLMPRMKVLGLHHLPGAGPCILSPNHQSYLDPLFICSALPYRMYRQLFFVGATEYFETPSAAWAARQLNLLPVDPDANLVSAMRAAAFGLRHGKALMLFPEGERSIDGAVKRFKKGAPILSRCASVPVVPVAIRGAFEVWPRNRNFQGRRLLPWSGHRIGVAFGSPMRFEGLTDADAAMALQKRVGELWTSLAPSPERGERGGAGEAAGEQDG